MVRLMHLNFAVIRSVARNLLHLNKVLHLNKE